MPVVGFYTVEVGFTSETFQVFLRQVFPVKPWPKPYEGLLIQPQNAPQPARKGFDSSGVIGHALMT
jgi:hypothetical protein